MCKLFLSVNTNFFHIQYSSHVYLKDKSYFVGLDRKILDTVLYSKKRSLVKYQS